MRRFMMCMMRHSVNNTEMCQRQRKLKVNDIVKVEFVLKLSFFMRP